MEGVVSWANHIQAIHSQRPILRSMKLLGQPIFFYIYGCKHSKVDQTSAPVYESRGFLGQTPINSSKMLFKVDCFL